MHPPIEATDKNWRLDLGALRTPGKRRIRFLFTHSTAAATVTATTISVSYCGYQSNIKVSNANALDLDASFVCFHTIKSHFCMHQNKYIHTKSQFKLSCDDHFT